MENVDATRITVGLWGPVQVSGRMATIHPVGAIRRGLLAVLAVNSGRYLTTERLIECCWERPTDSARANLRTHLSRLRGDLSTVSGVDGSRFLVSHRGAGHRLCSEAVTTDLTRVEDVMAVAVRALGERDYESAWGACRSARTSLRGTFGADLPDTPWSRMQADHFATTAHELAELTSAVQLCLGEHRQAVSRLRSLLVDRSTSRRSWRLVVCGNYLLGDTPAALAAVTACRERFAEVGLDAPTDVTGLLHPLLNDQKEAILEAARRF